MPLRCERLIDALIGGHLVALLLFATAQRTFVLLVRLVQLEELHVAQLCVILRCGVFL